MSQIFLVWWHFLCIFPTGTLCVICTFPFIFFGCLGCNNSSDYAQVIYFAPFVVIFQFGWAATQISHLSLIPTLTQDVHERTELNAIRLVFIYILKTDKFDTFGIIFFFLKQKWIN